MRITCTYLLLTMWNFVRCHEVKLNIKRFQGENVS